MLFNAFINVVDTLKLHRWRIVGELYFIDIAFIVISFMMSILILEK